MTKIILPVIIVLGVLAAGYFVYKQFAKTSRDNPTSAIMATPSDYSTIQELKTFQSSSVMKFSITLPNNFLVEERFGSVRIETPTGEILIGQNGTNFNDLIGYIENSQNNFKSRIVNREDLIINGLESIKGIIEDESVYLIYADYRVYSISTRTQPLYDDLDQIAQSFRYVP